MVEQRAALLKMQNLVETMAINGKSSLLPFQKGILVSIKATLDLFEYVEKEFGLNFLLTTHLNQDHLENLFSCLRGMIGNHQHPSPLECMRRLRIFLIGRNITLVIENAPVVLEKVGDGEYILPAAELNDDREDIEECVSKSLTSYVHDTALDDMEEELLPVDVLADLGEVWNDS